jgi:branched-chain amino acid transport system substrate-binding protein
MKPSKWILVFIFGVCIHTVVPFSVQARESIKIASLFSFTGAAAKANLSSIEVIRFAVDEINAAGGVLGLPLELIEIDNQSSPIVSKIAAEKAADAGVLAILGPAWSSHTLQAAKVAQAHGIPLISNVSTHPDITGIGDYIFRVCFNDLYQGWAMAQFARLDLKLRRAVVLVDLTSDYSIGLAHSFTTTFEHLGGDILQELHYKRHRQNFKKLVAQAAQLQPDVLFIPGYDESAIILIEAQSIGLKATMLGADGWDLESFYAMGGKNVKHGYFSTHWSEEMKNETSLSFLRKYKKQGPILASEALAYDAVYFLVDAVKRAGRPDREAVRDALAETTIFHGVTGDFTFDSKGDPVKSLVIMELKDGAPHYLRLIEPHKDVIDFVTPPPGSQTSQ